jgi:hypothetical protein
LAERVYLGRPAWCAREVLQEQLRQVSEPPAEGTLLSLAVRQSGRDQGRPAFFAGLFRCNRALTEASWLQCPAAAKPCPLRDSCETLVSPRAASTCHAAGRAARIQHPASQWPGIPALPQRYSATPRQQEQPHIPSKGKGRTRHFTGASRLSSKQKGEPDGSPSFLGAYVSRLRGRLRQRFHRLSRQPRRWCCHHRC